MSEENNNAEMSKSKSTGDETMKLSEEARGLGPMYAGPLVFGAVDMIVGEGGAEVTGFVATKNEVLQLVRYWATEILRLEFAFFLYGYSGSSEWRTSEFANRRLDTIGKLIGQEEVTDAYRQAEQAYGKCVDPQAWRIFMEGTPEEQERFQQVVQESLERAAKEGCT